MNWFRDRKTEKFIEAARVRLETQAKDLIDPVTGIIPSVRIGEVVVHADGVSVMSVDSFAKKYVAVNNAGFIDISSDVHGSEGFEDNTPKRSRKKAEEG